jgi:hypothetical protein
MGYVAETRHSLAICRSCRLRTKDVSVRKQWVEVARKAEQQQPHLLGAGSINGCGGCGVRRSGLLRLIGMR